MENKIYVHIGPHKTGSTSLQKEVFPFIEGCLFLGRKVGDVLHGDELYQKIIKFCFVEGGKYELEEIHATLKDILSTKSIIISEEWFTTDYDAYTYGEKFNWHTKLLRLKEVVGLFEYKVLAVKRDVYVAALSLYYEFKQIPYGDKYNSYMEFCDSSNDIGFYISGEEYIMAIFSGYVSVLDFDHLTNDNIVFRQGIANFLDIEDVPNLSKSNDKSVTKTSVLIKKQGKPLKWIKQFFNQKPRLKNLLFSIAFINSISVMFIDTLKSKEELQKVDDSEINKANARIKERMDMY